MQSISEQIVMVAKLVFERRLTDIAGGNISCRSGDQILITPTRAGQDQLWDLSPDDIVSAPIASDDLMSHPRRSKESISHLIVYRAYPEVGAIIHAHPLNVAPFCAAYEPVRPLMLSAEKFGTIELIPDAPLYSNLQGEYIVEKLAPRQVFMGQLAAAVLIPKHGIFVAGRTLLTCLDCLERVDNSAYTNLMSKLLRL
jgi:L-fuculose-phosphate aldolase